MSCSAFKMAKCGPGDTVPKIPMQKKLESTIMQFKQLSRKK